MKNEVIITANTVDEAMAQARRDYGSSENELAFEILEMPKKGFLGIGASDAKISASYTAGGEVRALSFIEKLLSDLLYLLSYSNSYSRDCDTLYNKYDVHPYILYALQTHQVVSLVRIFCIFWFPYFYTLSRIILQYSPLVAIHFPFL